MLVEISKRIKCPSAPGTKSELNEYEYPKVLTKIYTDGQIVKVDEPLEENIKEHYIGKEKYTHSVDKKKTRKVHLKNHTYAVVYTLAEEFVTIGNIHGFFKVVKDVTIYVNNNRDLTALRKANKTIQMIADNNRSIDYSSVFSMVFTIEQAPKKMEYEHQQENIYI